MNGKNYVDGVLVDWGSTLFNVRPVAPVAPKKGLTGLPLIPRRHPAGGGLTGQGRVKADATAIRSKLGSIVKRTPQVMVKISGGGKGMRQIKNHLDYISRNGKLEVEDQNGSTIKGHEELLDLHGEWQDGGFKVSDESEKREAFNIVLSMPKGTDSLAVKRAARDFAGREFANYQYVMVLHTFDTDPDPEPSHNPHVHLCVKSRSLDGTRLNPRKGDLQRWREGFAEALRENGVEAAATNRLQRLQRDRGQKQSVRQMKQRGKTLDRGGRSNASLERVAKAKHTQDMVLRGYREIAKALATSDDVDDRKLAVGIVHHLEEQVVQIDLNKSKEKDKGLKQEL